MVMREPFTIAATGVVNISYMRKPTTETSTPSTKAMNGRYDFFGSLVSMVGAPTISASRIGFDSIRYDENTNGDSVTQVEVAMHLT